ncbi:MAG: outer membrane lipid asymmetry maintenance protein MlaD [Gammaproteobacteria bacterium]
MTQRNSEVWVGIFMLAGMLALLMLALKVSGLSHAMGSQGYVVKAVFDNIGGLRPRAPVSLAGVRIGQVTHIDLDPRSFKAVVTIQIDKQQNALPSDTSASIFTEGLLGANYISLVPGYDETFLKNGDMIQDTRPALVLENLIGQLIFKLSGDKK